MLEKGKISKMQYKVELPESVPAPIKRGDKVGEIVFSCDGGEVGRTEILATEDIRKIGFFELWWRMLAKFLLK